MNNRARRWIKISSAVVVIIAILGTAGVVIYGANMHAEKVDTAIADIKEMQADIDAFYEKHNTPTWPRNCTRSGKSRKRNRIWNSDGSSGGGSSL